MRRVVWSSHARTEFKSVVGYIAQDSPKAARSVADRIDRTIRSLAHMPTGRKGRVSGTYEKVVGGLPYIIAYALGDDPRHQDTITILHVIHGAREWLEENWPE